MRKVMKETQERVRLFEENQRRWQAEHQQHQQHLQSPPMAQQVRGRREKTLERPKHTRILWFHVSQYSKSSVGSLPIALFSQLMWPL